MLSFKEKSARCCSSRVRISLSGMRGMRGLDSLDVKSEPKLSNKTWFLDRKSSYSSYFAWCCYCSLVLVPLMSTH